MESIKNPVITYLTSIIVISLFILLIKKIGNTILKQNTNYDAQNYQPKWMFSYNEKDFYKKLKKIVEQNGLELFAKVRLLDLVEPKNKVKKDKGYLWKIQAKHVDFVICDQKLVAKYIIELDDSSHDNSKRQERDEFVDTVLKATGYKVLHIRAFDENKINQFLGVSEPKEQI